MGGRTAGRVVAHSTLSREEQDERLKYLEGFRRSRILALTKEASKVRGRLIREIEDHDGRRPYKAWWAVAQSVSLRYLEAHTKLCRNRDSAGADHERLLVELGEANDELVRLRNGDLFREHWQGRFTRSPHKGWKPAISELRAVVVLAMTSQEWFIDNRADGSTKDIAIFDSLLFGKWLAGETADTSSTNQQSAKRKRARGSRADACLRDYNVNNPTSSVSEMVDAVYEQLKTQGEPLKRGTIQRRVREIFGAPKSKGRHLTR